MLSCVLVPVWSCKFHDACNIVHKLRSPSHPAASRLFISCVFAQIQTLGSPEEQNDEESNPSKLERNKQLVQEDQLNIQAAGFMFAAVLETI